MHPDDVHLLEGRRVDAELHDGDVLRIGEAEITVLHTPGHTAGSICLYAPPFLIAGDTLFPGGPGLTKRPGGDFALIVESIRDKLFTLPEATIVYPGHGRSTTIGAEKPPAEMSMVRCACIRPCRSSSTPIGTPGPTPSRSRAISVFISGYLSAIHWL